MRGAGGAILTLLAASGVGCQARLEPPRSDRPVERAEVVEERWPSGALRLRKHVLHLADGTVVDHGTFERWYDDGVKEYEAVFVRGAKEGTSVRYHRNGRKWAEQEYRDGKRHGRSLAWNDAGERVQEEHWEDGLPHGTWTVWEHGEIRWRHTYVHGDPAPEDGAPP